MKKKLIIFGDSGFAEIAYLYFSSQNTYEVVSFCVEEEYRSKNTLFGKNVLDFNKINNFFNPKECYFFAAITYHKLNTLRERIIDEARNLGFKIASYISDTAFIGAESVIGDHCFIFENNVIQPFVKIEENSILWSGNHIGHHSIIKKNCFISSHVVISGYCEIGKNSFLGVNSTISNNTIIGEYNWIGPTVNIQKNTDDNSIYHNKNSEKSKASSLKFFKI